MCVCVYSSIDILLCTGRQFSWFYLSSVLPTFLICLAEVHSPQAEFVNECTIDKLGKHFQVCSTKDKAEVLPTEDVLFLK